MDTQYIKKTMLTRVMTVMVILVTTLSVSMVAYAAPPFPFVGHWQANDMDGSDIRLTISGPPNGPYRITWTENYISFCNGEAGIVRGMGWLNGEDVNLLEATLQVNCLKTGESTTFELVLRFRPFTNTLISQYEQNGFITIWHRPGSQLPSLSIPTFVAYVPGAIEGYDWQLGDTVSININGDEYFAEAEVEESPWDPTQTRVLFEIWRDEVFIEAGDFIVMTDGVISKEVVVTNLAVTNIDVTARTVSGNYDPDNSLWVWLYDGEGLVPETDPKTGTWVATFSELPPGAWGGATQWDMDGDGTSLDFQVPNPHFSVFPEWEYVEGWRWPDESLVSATVEGKLECSVAEYSGHPEWDPNELFVGLWFPEACDVVVGDVVTVTDGVTPRTYEVQDLSITEVNKADSNVSGTAYVGALVYIWVHDYGYDMELLADNGTWFADFKVSGLEFIEGMGGRAEVRDEIGNATAVDWRIPMPEIRAWLGNQRVEGYQWPLEAWIDLYIDGNFIDSQQVQGDENWTFVGFDLNSWVLAPGQEITMNGGGTEKTHTILPVSITSVDTDLNVVEGTASNEGNIILCVYDGGCDPPIETFADASGNWSVDYGDDFDILPGFGMDATQFDDDGDGTSFDYWIPE